MATYTSYPESNGQLQIQGIDYIFESGTAITETAVTGEDYYDPNTGKMNRHSGQKTFSTITLTAIMSPPQLRALKTSYDLPAYSEGEITAIHNLGGVTTKLLKVRLSELSYGSFDKTSNNASKVTLNIDFADTVIV